MIYNFSPPKLCQQWHYGSIKSQLSKQKLACTIWQKLVLITRAARQNDELLLCEEQSYSPELAAHSLIRQAEIHQWTGTRVLLQVSYLRAQVGVLGFGREGIFSSSPLPQVKGKYRKFERFYYKAKERNRWKSSWEISLYSLNYCIRKMKAFLLQDFELRGLKILSLWETWKTVSQQIDHTKTLRLDCWLIILLVLITRRKYVIKLD